MTSTTSKGIPYPDPTDPVANGDDAIKALAQWVNDNIGKVKNGSDSITPSAANTTTSKVVTFPGTAFVNPPNVVVSPYNTTMAPGVVSIWVTNITTTQFQVNVQRTNTNPVPFQWIATN